MAKDAKVRVRLDTRQAKGDLRGLTKQAQKTSGRVGEGLRSALGRGFGALGLGAAAAAGGRAVLGRAQALGGTFLGGLTMGTMDTMEQMVAGQAGNVVRAGDRAAKMTQQAFGRQAGLLNDMPPSALEFFKMKRTEFANEEKGQAIIRQNLGNNNLQEFGQGISRELIIPIIVAIKAGLEKISDKIGTIDGK